MAKSKINLGLEVDASIVEELEDAYAIRYGYRAQVPNLEWKASKEQHIRDYISNPESKREFMINVIKKQVRKVLGDERAEKENKIKREKEKDLESMI